MHCFVSVMSAMLAVSQHPLGHVKDPHGNSKDGDLLQRGRNIHFMTVFNSGNNNGESDVRGEEKRVVSNTF